MSKLNIYKCKCTIIHEDIVNKLKEEMPEPKTLQELSELFKVFGDGTRIKIIYALSKAEMCVCDISAFTNMTQSAISHQLKILRQAKLVKYRREGKTIFYSLDDEHIKEIFNMGLLHVNE